MQTGTAIVLAAPRKETNTGGHKNIKGTCLLGCGGRFLFDCHQGLLELWKQLGAACFPKVMLRRRAWPPKQLPSPSQDCAAELEHVLWQMPDTGPVPWH